MMFDGILRLLPSGCVKITMEHGHFQWNFPLNMVIFSIAMLNYQRVPGQRWDKNWEKYSLATVYIIHCGKSQFFMGK